MRRRFEPNDLSTKLIMKNTRYLKLVNHGIHQRCFEGSDSTRSSNPQHLNTCLIRDCRLVCADSDLNPRPKQINVCRAHPIFSFFRKTNQNIKRNSLMTMWSLLAHIFSHQARLDWLDKKHYLTKNATRNYRQLTYTNGYIPVLNAPEPSFDLKCLYSYNVSSS